MFQIFVLLALFAAQVFAYDVGIKVTVSQDTLAVGTNISIVKDGTLLYNIRADGNGAASFRLNGGSYFVYLDRGGYPRHVNLLEIGKNENITYTLRQTISSASAYGQIIGPTDFSNSSVAAYAAGRVVKRTTPNKDGYYTLLYLPEGNYDVVFSTQGFVEKTEPASLITSQFTEVNAKLEKTAAVVEDALVISAPRFAKMQTTIEVVVMKGSMPVAEQALDVKTPSGSVEVFTDIDGKAHVNAVVSGEYVFTYGNLTATTVVEGEAEVPVQQPPVVISDPVIPPAEVQAPSDNGLMAGIAGVAMAGLIVAIGIILFVASRMTKKQTPKETAPDASEKPKHAPAHKHKHKK